MNEIPEAKHIISNRLIYLITFMERSYYYGKVLYDFKLCSILGIKCAILFNCQHFKFEPKVKEEKYYIGSS